MKKILCATDFSPAAKNGVSYAAQLAKELNGTLTLVHVRVLADMTPEEALLGVGWANEDVLSERLDDLCGEVERVFRVPCDVMIGHAIGSPSHSLRDLKGFDLQVVGTNGEDNGFQAYFGSNAYQIIRKTIVPTIIVPEDWLYGKIRTIAYAYDLFERLELPLIQVVRLARALHASLKILQVVQEPYEQDIGLKLEDEKKTITSAYAGDVSIDFKTVKNDDIADGIQYFVSQESPDILALCMRHNNIYRLLAQSVLKTITAAPKVPLFVFHY